MIVRQILPVDKAFCIDTDVEPWILWGELPPDWVVKIMELSQPVGFLIYRFNKDSVVEILKLCIREDLWRTGLGTETLCWLRDRAKKRGYLSLECKLTEEQALNDGGATPFVSLLRHCDFEGRLRRGKYIFTRACQ
jgi:hypothetical protein